MPDLDWMKIKLEYVTTNISLRNIAEKYDIPFPTVRDRSKREMWANEKGKAKTSIEQKTLQKVIANTSQKLAVTLQKELEAAELINNLVLEAFKDPRQFYLYPIEETKQGLEKVQKETTRGTSEEIVKVNNTTTISKDLGILDSKRLKDLADALSKSTDLKKKILGILDPAIQEKLAIDREKLDLDRQNLDIAKTKAGIGSDDEEVQTGIVYLPAVDEESYEKEKAEELARLQAEKAAREGES